MFDLEPVSLWLINLRSLTSACVSHLMWCFFQNRIVGSILTILIMANLSRLISACGSHCADPLHYALLTFSHHTFLYKYLKF